MASKKQVLILLFSLFTVSLIIHSSQCSNLVSADCSGKISVYWGQGKNFTYEGNLTEACDTGHYNIVILETLHVYDDGSTTPYLNLEGHCPYGDCTKLEPEIEYCQGKDIQVLLSIELDPISSSPVEGVAEVLAEYLLDKFLSGKAGPLGNVALDGIDIANYKESENLHWDELVRAINASTKERKIYLSAAPRCDHDNPGLDKAIATGLLDYIWVIYYNNYASCEYLNNGTENLLRSWKDWTSSVLPNNSVFLGIPASDDPGDVSSGYIPPDVLTSEILPIAKQAENYGGVMIWDRYYDKQTNYSGQIKGVVLSQPASRASLFQSM